MANYAKVIDGIVAKIIVAEIEFFDTFIDSRPGQWVESTYDASNGIVTQGNCAGIGSTYDSVEDVFYSAKPYPSWILNKTTWTWEAPTAMPTDGMYSWNEATLSWVVLVK